jgi:DNA repair exonuclease SbcCD ATPase subunit
MIVLNNKSNVETIIHIADIHIRPYKRHQEYNEVFNNLYSSIKDSIDGESIIVVAGDIVHAKTEMSPELIMITSDFLKNLSSILPTIVIPGNHDANLSNTSRMDAITPIIKNILNDNLFYLKESGIFKYGNLNFIHMSVFDDRQNYITFEEVKDLENKIALFHGPITNAVNEFNYKFNTNIDVDQFDGFDLTLLGDIHKRQFLDANKTVAYPGSLIQQNYGEELVHGYLKWNVKTKKSKFIKVKNDYGYYTVDIKDSIPDLSFIPKKCRLRLKIYEKNEEETKSIINEIKSKYKPLEVVYSVINKFNDTYSSKSNIELGDLKNVKYQNELIINYIQSKYEISDELKTKIFFIGENINKKIIFEDQVRNVRWNPVRFEWSNMFSYGENNVIDFSSMKDVIGLFAPNASGKSSLLDSIIFCLFDKCSRDATPSEILNNKSNNFYCKLEFILSGEKFIIERKFKKSKTGSGTYKVNFLTYNRNGEEINLNGENRFKTNDKIRQIIGSFDDFILTSISLQENNKGYISKGNSGRKDILIKFLGLQIFDFLEDAASKDIKDSIILLKNLEKINWIEDLDEKNRLYDENKNEYIKTQNEEKELEENINILKSEINELKSKLIKIPMTLDISKLNQELITVENEKKIIEEKILDCDENYSLIAKMIDELNVNSSLYEHIGIKNMIEELDELRTDLKNLENEIDKLKVSVKYKLEKMEKLEKLEYDENCKFCMNNIFVKDAINTKKLLEEDKITAEILLKKQEAFFEIIKSKEFLKDEYKKYSEIVNKKIKGENAILKTDNEKKTYEIKLNKIETKIKDINEKISMYYEQKENIEFNKQIMEDVDFMSTQVSQHLLLQKQIMNKSKTIYGEMKVLENRIEEIKKNINKIIELSSEIEAYKLYLEAVKRDGLPFELISKIAPMLETEVNNTLCQFVDFTQKIELDEYKNINIKICYGDENYWPIELTSGWEKFVSALSLRIALTKISNLPRANFLIIDEGWGNFDGDNINSVSMLVDYLKTQFEFLVIISHIQQIKDVASSFIDIKNIDGFSYISYLN